jgi:hypothetical protein
MISHNLSIGNALRGLEEFIRDKMAPAIDDPFVAPMARLSGMLLRICANSVDDAAELRIDENAAIRLILGEATALVPPPLASRLREAAASTDPGLKISVSCWSRRKPRWRTAPAPPQRRSINASGSCWKR